MTQGQAAQEALPAAVTEVLDEFRQAFSLDLHLWRSQADGTWYRLDPAEGTEAPFGESLTLTLSTRTSTPVTLEVRGRLDDRAREAVRPLQRVLEHLFDYTEEVRFFTYEVSERYEEINLLYSISETLGSLLQLKDASRTILAEVCDVMGARRGSLWVLDPTEGRLHLVASVGDEGREGPLETHDATSVTAQVFREGRPLILTGDHFESNHGTLGGYGADDSVLSVPIRYTPMEGPARPVGVINLFGRRRGGRFTASDQKLLAAIASQVGAALENNRLVRESLEQERVTREMELAHDLQMKLLPTGEGFDPERIAARVEPAESVGGDFYHFFRLSGDQVGVMIGDVSSHGFPAALIMALSMSAATIYATEVQSPARVFAGMAEALMDELESTEMYLSLFYGVVDPARGVMVYANAGHPHAFVIRGDGEIERLGALDPPMGIAGVVDYQEGTVSLTADEDLILLFTDGLSDDLAEGSRSAGETKVVEEVVRLRNQPVTEVVEALFELERREVSGIREADDRTAVMLRV